jgi:hypothetical protein
VTKLNAIWIFLSKIFRFYKGIVYNFFAKLIIPPKKKQCFGSGFNQISGSGSGFGLRIRIPDSDSGFGFRIRIPDLDSDSGFRILIRIPDSDSGFGFGFRIRIPDSDSDSGFGFVFRIQNPYFGIRIADSRFGFQIRIPDSESGSGSRRAKMIHKNRKNKKFHVLKCWMFSFKS